MDLISRPRASPTQASRGRLIEQEKLCASAFDRTLADLSALHCKEVGRLRQENLRLKKQITEHQDPASVHEEKAWVNDADDEVSSTEEVLELGQNPVQPALKQWAPDKQPDHDGGHREAPVSQQPEFHSEKVCEVSVVRESSARSNYRATASSGMTNKVSTRCHGVKAVIGSDQAQKILNGYMREMGSLAVKPGVFRRGFGCQIKSLGTVMRHEASMVPHYFNAKRFAQALLLNNSFNMLCAGLIIVNALLIGVSVDWAAAHDQQENAVLARILEVCNVFFGFELFLRIFAAGCREFFIGDENRWWNIFDSILVLFSGVEPIFSVVAEQSDNSNLSVFGSVVKTIKMLRVVRLLRVFRFFRELSELGTMIVEAGKSLMSAMVTLAIIVFVFACCFTSSATGWLHETGQDDGGKIGKYFGSMSKTVYTLIQSSIGGVSWGDVSDQLLKLNVFVTLLFLFYVIFTILAVLNIITGVFVENAVEIARTHRDFLLKREQEVRDKYVRELQTLFAEIDEDHSGRLSTEEIFTSFDEPGVQAYFKALDLEFGDVERLFALIDSDGSGDISLKEFIDGCLRLKGSAKSIDVFHLQLICNRIEAMLQKIKLERQETGLSAPAECGAELL